MRSLHALTLVLVLLVLVPAGVLGYLGIRGAERYGAEVDARVRTELGMATRALRLSADRLVARERGDTQARLAWARERLLADLPFGAPHEVLERVRSGLAGARSAERAAPGADPAEALDLDALWATARVDLRILAADGRAVLPREWDPDRPGGGVSEEGLLAHLRQDADAAWFGRHDLPAALSVWSAAQERDAAGALGLAFAAEQAWLRARAEPAEPASRQVQRLLGAHDAADLVRAGRPWVLLLLAAALSDEPGLARALLRALDEQGRLLEVPLTGEERERIVRLLTPPRPERAGEPAREALEAARVPLSDGLVLEVVRRWAGAQAGPGAALAQAWARSGGGPDHPRLVLSDIDHTPQAGWDAGERAHVWTEVPLPAGARAWALLQHPQERALWAEVDRARRLTWIGVGALLGVLLLGLLVGRVALARERDARRLQDDFLANVSHELRTPLTSVCLHADLLGEPGLAEPQRRAHAEVVRAEGARLSALVDDLLDFAALSRGARRLEPAPVHLGAAVEHAIAPFRILAEREGVVLHTGPTEPGSSFNQFRGSSSSEDGDDRNWLKEEPGSVLASLNQFRGSSSSEDGDDRNRLKEEPGSVLALADPHALARILANLVGNAWKHGRPSRDGAPGRIGLRLVAGAPPSTGPAIEVQDDGPGIPEAERAHLFERFRRGALASRVRGVGLGLALSRDLARAMGGDLVLVSHPTATLFRLTLRRVPPVDEEGRS